MIEPNKVQLGTGHDFFTKIIDKAEHGVQHGIKKAQRKIAKAEKKAKDQAKGEQGKEQQAPEETQNPNINKRQFPTGAEPTTTVPKPTKAPKTGMDKTQAPKVSFENKQTAPPVSAPRKPKTGPRSGSGFNAGVTRGNPSGPKVARSTYKPAKGMTPPSK